MRLSENDFHTLGEAKRYEDRFTIGIFPRGAGQWAHFRKLERWGLIEFSDFGFDENGEVDGEVAIFKLTDKGRSALPKEGEDCLTT